MLNQTADMLDGQAQIQQGMQQLGSKDPSQQSAGLRQVSGGLQKISPKK
jgi:hypothetical protein